MGSKSSIRLNQGQTFNLFQWVRAGHQEFNGKTDKAVALLAAESLGFPVSESTISNIRTDPDIDISWRTSKEKEPAPVVFDGDDMRVVAKTLLSVMGALNNCQIPVDAPPEFGALLGRLGISCFSQSIQQFLDLKAAGSE